VLRLDMGIYDALFERGQRDNLEIMGASMVGAGPGLDAGVEASGRRALDRPPPRICCSGGRPARPSLTSTSSTSAAWRADVVAHLDALDFIEAKSNARVPGPARDGQEQPVDRASASGPAWPATGVAFATAAQ